MDEIVGGGVRRVQRVFAECGQELEYHLSRVSRIDCILWDFGNTLADERWAKRGAADIPRWTEVWRGVRTDLAHEWNCGRVTSTVVAEELSAQLDVAPARILKHLTDNCRRIQFFNAAWTTAQQRRCPQTIVTVNPAMWSEVVVPYYGLRSVFDNIVTSWQQATSEEADLCEEALGRLGSTIPRERAPLIDNSADNVRAWRKRGGLAYEFTDDHTFRLDLDSGLLG